MSSHLYTCVSAPILCLQYLFTVVMESVLPISIKETSAMEDNFTTSEPRWSSLNSKTSSHHDPEETSCMARKGADFQGRVLASQYCSVLHLCAGPEGVRKIQVFTSFQLDSVSHRHGANRNCRNLLHKESDSSSILLITWILPTKGAHHGEELESMPHCQTGCLLE